MQLSFFFLIMIVNFAIYLIMVANFVGNFTATFYGKKRRAREREQKVKVISVETVYRVN